jgi:hypothetical protein
MGRCVKCGRETGHGYEYYTGDLVRSETSPGGGPGVKYTVKRTYENITHASGFFCVRCSHIAPLCAYGLSAAIMLIFTLPNFVFRLRLGRTFSNMVIDVSARIHRIPFLRDLQAISRSVGRNRALSMPLFICGITLLIMFLFNCRSIIRDKPVSKSWGSRILVAYLRKRIKNKTLFTVEERERLK